jgi:heme exporter protein D
MAFLVWVTVDITLCSIFSLLCANKLMQEHPHLDQAGQRVEAKKQLDSASTHIFEFL